LIVKAPGQQAVQPGKPEEALLTLLFEQLKAHVGVSWAIVILVLAGGFIGYLVKDAIPKLVIFAQPREKSNGPKLKYSSLIFSFIIQ
jgi:hypothetical protein